MKKSLTILSIMLMSASAAMAAPEPSHASAAAQNNPKMIEEDIDFVIDTYNIRPCEYIKLADLVGYLRQHPEAEVTLSGYADVETGTHPYNMALSQRRADAVMFELERAGVEMERIHKNAYGDTVQPFAVNEDNRVLVAVINK